MTVSGGDLDASLQELLTEAMEELERSMASKEAETGGEFSEGTHHVVFFEGPQKND